MSGTATRSLRAPVDLWEAFGRHAAASGQTINGRMIDLMRAAVDGAPAAKDAGTARLLAGQAATDKKLHEEITQLMDWLEPQLKALRPSAPKLPAAAPPKPESEYGGGSASRAR